METDVCRCEPWVWYRGCLQQLQRLAGGRVWHWGVRVDGRWDLDQSLDAERVKLWSRFGVFLKKWKKSSTESDDSKLGWSFMISTREIIEFHVALNLDWFLQNGDLPFFIHPNFLMSTMATWLSRSPLVPRYLCLMSVPIGSYSLQVGGLFELDPTERDHGTTVLLYEKETRICHNWDLGDYFLRPLWGKKITNLCLVERFWLISGTFYS